MPPAKGPATLVRGGPGSATAAKSSALLGDPSAWLRTASSLDGNLPLSLTQKASALAAAEAKAQRLEAGEIAEFCRHVPQVAERLGDNITATPIAGGLTNHSFGVAGTKGSVFVKRAEDCHMQQRHIALSTARLASEAVAMRLGHACAPEAVPACLHYDPATHTIVSDFVGGRMTLTESLLRGAMHPGLGAALGAALARVAFGTSPSALGATGHARLGALLEGSSSVADMMEDFVFVLPLDPSAPHNRWPSELNDDVATLVHGDAALLSEAAALHASRASPAPGQTVLVHTDLWLNNLLVPAQASDSAAGHQRQQERAAAAAADGGAANGAAGAPPGPVTMIDFEFGALGPVWYDVGHVVVMLLLGAFLVRAYADAEAEAAASGPEAAAGARAGRPAVAPEARRAQERWLLSEAAAVWGAFCEEWDCVSGKHQAGQALAAAAAAAVGAQQGGGSSSAAKGAKASAGQQPPQPQPPLERPSLADALGIGGLVGVRWAIGSFNIFGCLGVEEGTRPYVAAVRRSVRVCSAMLRDRRAFGGVEEVVALAGAALADN